MNNVMLRQQSMYKYLLIVFYISIFLLPTNLFLAWRLPESFIQGHFIDYLAPKIYLSQIMLGVLGVVWVLKTGVATRGKQVLRRYFEDFSWRSHVGLTSLLFFVMILLFQVVRWQDIGLLSLLINFVVGPLFFSLFLWKERVLVRTHLYIAVGIATTLQAFLGLVQWWRQDSLFGYWFFGEPNLRLPEVMTSSLPGPVQILPYGTTPHPNILAGWLVLGVLCLLHLWKAQGKRAKNWVHIAFFALIALHSFTLFLTESWVAGVSLPILLLFSHFSVSFYTWLERVSHRVRVPVSAGIVGILLLVQALWLLFPLVLQGNPLMTGLVEPTSLTRRSSLQAHSLELLQTEPSGSGFTRMFQHLYTSESTYVGGRFLQPPHNSGVLLLTVAGFWVIIVILYYGFFAHNKYSFYTLVFLLCIPVFTLDHYFISTISGQFLLSLILLYLSKSYCNNDL